MTIRGQLSLFDTAGKLTRMNPWGRRAMERWKSHLPQRYAALDDPVTYFTRLGEDATARYLEIRHGLLKGLNPNNGTIDWATVQENAAQADQTALEIVGSEVIYLPD